ncbi:hypothetical protein PDESU_01483 [Pontiella desulfatans]|uniref:Uncharacterized protein n=1 Tax=Pontiella desulfatans TaxID=2750659 RepID=A0A6C2TZC8_PONDE|nr:hypothetical protein [Pontiella desulfatans]VGO12929.1 hypothetical protein PDESU_01483 [Pontiella desulfatans]
MVRQLNSASEMARRLVFLFYIVVFTTYLFSCVIALALHGVSEICVACGSFILLSVVRIVGYRWLDFERLSDSFPGGCALDCIPRNVRTEVEALVDEFHAPGTDWTRRVAIRHRLVALEEEEPEIIKAFEDDLKAVLAA